MDVASREQFLAACCDPTVTGSGLTLWAIPIAATVVGDGGPMPTVGALVEVTSESSGATACNGQQHFDVLPADPQAATLSLLELLSRDATIRPRKLSWIKEWRPRKQEPHPRSLKVGLCLGGVQSGMKLGGRIEGKSVGADHAFD
jgi:hypothetical protein